jgi:hypothetical protein
MAVGEIISVSRFNLMQNRIAEVLGQGQLTFGYGQLLSSSPVSLTNTVSANHLNFLKEDINKVNVHQTGNSVSLATIIANADVEDAEWLSYETLATTLYNSKQDVYLANQVSTENKLSSTRSSTWGDPVNILTHTFKVIFAGGYTVGKTDGTTVSATGANHRRHFFNSGGEIRLVASLAGSSGDKSTYWRDLLSSMGTIKFTYNGVTASSGTGTSIGNNSLTGTFQTLYSKQSTGIYAGINAEYIVKARTINSSTIEFQVTFVDRDAGIIDETINGTLTSSVSQLRATGSYVDVMTPSYLTTTPLE